MTDLTVPDTVPSFMLPYLHAPCPPLAPPVGTCSIPDRSHPESPAVGEPFNARPLHNLPCVSRVNLAPLSALPPADGGVDLFSRRCLRIVKG